MAIVKEAEFKTCNECGQGHRISEEVRGCDVCNRVFPEEGVTLSCDVFYKGGDGDGVDRIDICSWTCALKALRAIERDCFVSLPPLYYDYPNNPDTPEGARAEDFFAAIKAFSAAEVNTKK